MSTLTEEIKARVDLVDLIGRSVQLKRVGSAYRGLCPFHTEKTPSFYVRTQTNTWHCFGCNKGGSAIDWLMEREQLEFGEALRTLAHMTGVALPERREPEEEEQTRRLYSILERSQSFYEGLLWGASGSRAREYLRKRGLNDETARSFGLGYAPTGNGLLHYLERDGFGEQELQAAGVSSIADDGHAFDFFRDRLLFPIRDAQGRTIAFGGRSLDDAATPKYLNSRDTLLFHKHETLFGLDLARRPMSQERQVVIVEGYMDAAMAHQHSYRNVVATLGTAVTDRHLRSLRRQVDEIVLALDADAAGQAATWRALQVADESLRTGLTPVVGPSRRQQRFVAARSVRLRVLALPGAKDPDDLIRTDPTAWPALVRQAIPVIDFVLQRLGGRHDLTTAQGKAAAAAEAADVLAGIASPIEQDHYIQETAALLKVDPGAVRQILRHTHRHAARIESNRPPDNAPAAASAAPHVAVDEPVEINTDDEYLLALLMRLREIPDAPAIDTDAELEFVLPQSKALYAALSGGVPEELRGYAVGARQKLEDVRRLSVPVVMKELAQTRLRIRDALIERRRAQIASLMRDAASDPAEYERLAALLQENLSDRVALTQSLEGERAGTR